MLPGDLTPLFAAFQAHFVIFARTMPLRGVNIRGNETTVVTSFFWSIIRAENPGSFQSNNQ
jgi:hypothetical protein